MTKTDELRSFPLLSSITLEEADALAKVVKEQVFTENQDIIQEGDTGSWMYILISGTVDIIKTTVYGDPFICATLKDSMHATFGEMALIDNDKRSATVRAKNQCKTYVLYNEDFQKYCEQYPSAGVKLLTMISKNLIRNLRKENENLKLVYTALIDEIEAN